MEIRFKNHVADARRTGHSEPGAREHRLIGQISLKSLSANLIASRAVISRPGANAQEMAAYIWCKIARTATEHTWEAVFATRAYNVLAAGKILRAPDNNRGMRR